jgi:hypothetical protein
VLVADKELRVGALRGPVQAKGPRRRVGNDVVLIVVQDHSVLNLWLLLQLLQLQGRQRGLGPGSRESLRSQEGRGSRRFGQGVTHGLHTRLEVLSALGLDPSMGEISTHTLLLSWQGLGLDETAG